MKPHIVGVMMVKDEDVWLRHAIRAIRAFTDEVLVIDTGSTDGTLDIAREEQTILVREPNLRHTHYYVQSYLEAGWWVFGVDGDEVYDPVGLEKVRDAMAHGEHERSWQLCAVFLHALEVHVDILRGWDAYGYLAPPAHAPSKLYNGAMCRGWECDERRTLFHPKTLALAPGVLQRDNTYQRMGWDKSPLRCLHTRFCQRSSIQTEPEDRLNPEDLIGHGSKADHGKGNGNQRLKYRVGPVEHRNVSQFFLVNAPASA